MAEGSKSAGLYYAAAQNLPADQLRSTFAESGLSEDEVRAIRTAAIEAKTNYELGQNSGSIDSRIAIGAAQANRRRGERESKAKAKARNDDTTLLAILNDIARLEDELAQQYGDGFAGDLLADLNAKGLIETQEYTRIMAISDDTERRRTIALRVQEGLDNGTIKPSDLKGHPWAQEWLEKHDAATQAMVVQAAQYERGELSANALAENAKDEAGELAATRTPDQETEVEAAAVAVEQSEQVRFDTAEVATNFDVSSLRF